MPSIVTRVASTMFELLLIPAVGGILVAIVAGPLGAFTVWRGMAYFGDTLAHSALLGVALALVLDISLPLGILFCSICIAILLVVLQNKTRMSSDSVLGILSHSSLAVGLLVVSLLPGRPVDLFAFLFGDLLTITLGDLWLIFVFAFATLGIIVYCWRGLLMLSIDEELAQVEGQHTTALQLLLVLLMSIIVAVAIKTVGLLLITALLIIPAAAAQRLARSPESMVIFASAIGVISVIGGLYLSASVDAATGPAIVVCATVIFFSSFIYAKLFRLER